MPSWLKTIVKKTFVFKYLIGPYDWIMLVWSTIQTARRIKNLPNDRSLFFFFPFYHIGGAEKVHLDIVRATKEKKPVIFFTLPSSTSLLEKDFSDVATCFYIYPFIRKKGILSNYFKKVIAQKVNGSKAPKAFSSNCLYFYQIINHFSNHVECIDLIHAFVEEDGYGAEQWSLPFVERINKRVVINKKTYNDLLLQYKENNINAKLFDRIALIKNAVTVPQSIPKKNYTAPLNIIFVSRNSPEKRVPLIGKVCALASKKYHATAHLIGGDLDTSISSEDLPFLNMHGAIYDEKKLYDLYSNAHILILLSEREGMPLSIMEAMANGCAIISTNVGGIAYDVNIPEGGILLSNDLYPEGLIAAAIKAIDTLNTNRILLEKMSNYNFIYARNNFSVEIFNSSYKKLLA